MRSCKILSFSIVILLITVVFAGAVPAAAQTDTMQYRYNATHTGDYSPNDEGHITDHYLRVL